MLEKELPLKHHCVLRCRMERAQVIGVTASFSFPTYSRGRSWFQLTMSVVVETGFQVHCLHECQFLICGDERSSVSEAQGIVGGGGIACRAAWWPG